MRKYAIWNKCDDICTATGNVYTAEQWKEKHPIAKRADVIIVCAAGTVNGMIFGILSQMQQEREALGADFSKCKTDDEILEAIEIFDEEMNTQQDCEVSNEELTATSLASIAASLEYQNMMTLEDTEVE